MRDGVNVVLHIYLSARTRRAFLRPPPNAGRVGFYQQFEKLVPAAPASGTGLAAAPRNSGAAAISRTNYRHHTFTPVLTIWLTIIVSRSIDAMLNATASVKHENAW
jgi:hypothetical protein